jgi:hypothetical protein
VTGICGTAPVAGFVPIISDTTTSTCPWSGRVWTADASMAGQITTLKRGSGRAFVSASSQYLTTPDADALSFGNGTTDSPFSIVALANITDTAAARAFVTKSSSGIDEWQFFVTVTDVLRLLVFDASAAVSALATSAAIVQGAWKFFGATYDGRGGATAADGMALYQDGVALGVGPTNNASYVAMENGTAACEVGSSAVHTAQLFDGSMAFVIVVPAALTAAQMVGLTALCRSFYGVPA